VRKAVLKRYPSLKGKAAPGSVGSATKRGTSRKRVKRSTHR
jgi:hypothetical protein